MNHTWKTCYIRKKYNHGVWIKEKDPEYYEIKGNKIVVDNIDKPLKTLSNYKKGNLQDICKKLKIQFEFEGQKKFTKKKIEVSFTPHLSPMFRGILSTIYLDLNKNVNQSKVIALLSKFYKKEKFVKISKSNTLISTNDVINTNNCLISVCKSKFNNKIIILSAIDNLIKGGAGQAVQSLNNRFNYPQTTGLI